MKNGGIKPSLILIFLLHFIFSCDMHSPVDPAIYEDLNDLQKIFDQTSRDSLIKYTQVLSGEISYRFGDSLRFIRSRHQNYPGNELAADYFHNKLTAYGLPVYWQHYSTSGSNIYAIQTGTVYPDASYIICAHYDSMPDSSLAPGADDNASGCAAVLEAARILAPYRTAYTVIYALWDEEEEGLLGSSAFAERALSNKQNILGVINMDMIGWDSNNDGRFLIAMLDTARSDLLALRMQAVHDKYGFALSPIVINHTIASDNRSFWEKGFSAVAVIELLGEDWNPYYHTTGDRFLYLNQDYLHNITRLCIGTLASLVTITEIT